MEGELTNHIKSQLLPVNFYFVLDQFQIKRARFSLVFPTYVQFLTQIVVLYFLETLAANLFSSHQKVVRHAQQKPVHSFTSHQKAIDLNN